MDYDKYVKIPMFIILDRNVCNNNKTLYWIIILLSHREGYCYADNKYLGNCLGVSSRRISGLLRELSDNNYITMEYKHRFQRKIYINKEKFTSDLLENFF